MRLLATMHNPDDYSSEARWDHDPANGLVTAEPSIDRAVRTAWFECQCTASRSAGRAMARRLVSRVVVPVLAVALSAIPAASQGAPSAVRTLIGDVALIIRPAEGGETVRIGVAGPNRSLTLAVRVSDARRWSDSAGRLLAPPPRRSARAAKAAGVARARAVLEEPGDGTGSLILSRTDSGGARSFLLFVDDAGLDAIRQPLTNDDAALLVRLLRRATPPPVKRPSAKQAPAKKAPAKKIPAKKVPTKAAPAR